MSNHEVKLLKALDEARHDNAQAVDPNSMMGYVQDNDCLMHHLKLYNATVGGNTDTPGWKAFIKWLEQTDFPLDREISCF